MEPAKVYLEVGEKRTFAGALEWPGWCRSGRDPESALQELDGYAPRYATAIAGARCGFKPPLGSDPFKIAERLKGDATTDFGAPSASPKYDERDLDERSLNRAQKLLQACWATFDSAADAASDVVLLKGPRGGGRDVGEIVSHVFEADKAYLGRLGGRFKKDGDDEMAALRAAFIRAAVARAHDEPPEPSRRKAPLWTPSYGIRRSAWHALDHAWEIEDRSA